MESTLDCINIIHIPVETVSLNNIFADNSCVLEMEISLAARVSKIEILFAAMLKTLH